MTKIEAIAHLEKCFKHDPAYAQKWRSYIEIIVTEQLEDHKVDMPPKKLEMLRRAIGAEVITTLFQADWWKLQQ